MRRILRVVPPLVLAALASGCSMIPVKMHMETRTMNADGRVETKTKDWEGTLDQLPGELAKAGSELGDVTAKMVKQLTDVPPPGKVELKDLGPGMEQYQNRPETDFLQAARNDKGEKEEFSYVRLGVDSYDDFFKTAQELHALTWQATQTTSHMRQLTTKILSEKVDASADLHAAVEKGLASGSADAALKTRLGGLASMGALLGTLVPRMVSKTTQLVSAGQKLVTGMPTSLTNPKLVTHFPLVKQGLLSSIAVIHESGGAMLGLGKELGGFRRTTVGLLVPSEQRTGLAIAQPWLPDPR